MSDGCVEGCRAPFGAHHRDCKPYRYARPEPAGRAYQQGGGADWPRHGVHKLGDGTWMVPSKDTPGAWRHVIYTTDPQTGHVGFRCSCPAGQTRGEMGAHDDQAPVCSHVKTVGRAEADDGYPPRPPGAVTPTAISGMVD